MEDSRYTPNELFRSARIRLFGTREALADAVNAHLAPAFLITAADIGKIERGVVTFPRSPRRAAFRTVFGVAADAEIGFRNTRADQEAQGDPAGTPADTRSCTTSVTHDGGCQQRPALQAQSLVRPQTTSYPALLRSGQPMDLFCSGPSQAANRGGDVGETTDTFLLTPAGRFLSGLAIPVQLHPAVLSEQVMTRVPENYAEDPFIRRSSRALVVGQVGEPDSGAFVLDSRHARRRLRGAAGEARLPIPRAYRLDELALALLWAVAAFDDALLNDDAVLTASVHDIAGYAAMDRSAASRDVAVDASPASLMWLGSMFCADHIRRHTSDLTGPPVFWTREQRGEEAASWLLFTHKNQYLQDTSGRAGPGEQLVRAFCVPRSAVAESASSERALLLLAAALMESYGIRATVTDASELAATPGFVYDNDRRAITATWIGADGVWYVDVVDDRTTLRGFADAAGHAIHHSVCPGATPERRLQVLADYLGLDWTWLVVRCTELATCGRAGIAQPRSRLLSLAGFDRACRFLADTAGSGN
ncbi:hypothetical protein [Paractinoplanes globisporus]|uniref:XRE family transcriptional regulator n=1 Tax=Paractinoplanes globisporus TaxID=113565 RepID=A0ABW6WF36_9ACTN|nr:hypothetical protein [Actinoplanes globisporus]